MTRIAPYKASRRPSAQAGASAMGQLAVPPEITCGTPNCYALVVEGNCMSPEANDGDHLIASPDAPLELGKLVVLYPKKGRLGVKRLVLRPMPNFMAFTSDWELVPLVIVEMLNPPRRFDITVDKLKAVHGVLAVIRKEEAMVIPDKAAETRSRRKRPTNRSRHS